ncbi:hypothetical protein ATM97_29510 [Nocardia sp. MH4]|nr:hypothetical protein [Nocardia sp. MH4]
MTGEYRSQELGDEFEEGDRCGLCQTDSSEAIIADEQSGNRLLSAGGVNSGLYEDQHGRCEIRLSGEWPANPVEVAAGRPQDDARDHRFTVREVPVHGGPRDAGLPSDVLHRRRRESDLFEAELCGIK